MTQTRLIAGLSALCLVLIGVTVWALATRTPGAAERPTYWVAPDGNDDGSGSSDDPWATLQKADA